MKKEEINEFMNMTLQEKKDKIIEIIREIPEDSPIHNVFYRSDGTGGNIFHDCIIALVDDENGCT